MVEYIEDGEGEPHVRNSGSDYAEAGKEAFEFLLEKHGLEDEVDIIEVEKKGLNPEFSHNIPSHIGAIKYTKLDSSVENICHINAKPFDSDGEVLTFDDENAEIDKWEVTVLDHFYANGGRMPTALAVG